MIVKRKPLYRRRRIVKRKFNIRRSRMNRAQGNSSVFKVKRTFWAQIWQPGTAAVNDYWRFFQYSAGNMPDFSQYASIYDSYKITGIKIYFMPRFDSFSGENRTTVGTTNNSGVRVSFIKDPWTSTAPAGVYTSGTYNQFCENGAVQLRTGNKPFSIYFRPTIANTTAGGTNQLVPAPWLPVTNNSITHFGVHAFAHDHNFSGNNLASQAWDIHVTYYVKFKGSR